MSVSCGKAQIVLVLGIRCAKNKKNSDSPNRFSSFTLSQTFINLERSELKRHSNQSDRASDRSISMALSCSWSPTLFATTQSSSLSTPPKLVHSHSPLTSFSFPSKPTTTLPTPSHKWRAKISFFPAFLSKGKGKDAKTLKEELLDAIASLNRGADATPQDQQAVDEVSSFLLFSTFSFHLFSAFLFFFV